MPIVYLPKYIKENDYQILKWLDLCGGGSDIDLKMIDYLNLNLKVLDTSLKRLYKEGFLFLYWNGDDIMKAELTEKAQTFLAEHILGQTTKQIRR